MFSGKTTELQARLRRHKLAGTGTVVVLKHDIDDRYQVPGEAAVISHDGRTWPAISCASLEDAAPLVESAAVVGIDEAHFFGDLELCEEWASAGKIVIVAGHDATFERTPFMPVVRLICKAESVTKLTAVCAHCGADASFSHRTIPTTASASDVSAYVLVGGAEAYESLCRSCHAAATASLCVPSPYRRSVAEPNASATETTVQPAVASPPVVPPMSATKRFTTKRQALAALSNSMSALDFVSSPMASAGQHVAGAAPSSDIRMIRARVMATGPRTEMGVRLLR
jgi:thymidine kinase